MAEVPVSFAKTLKTFRLTTDEQCSTDARKVATDTKLLDGRQLRSFRDANRSVSVPRKGPHREKPESCQRWQPTALKAVMKKSCQREVLDVGSETEHESAKSRNPVAPSWKTGTVRSRLPSVLSDVFPVFDLLAIDDDLAPYVGSKFAEIFLRKDQRVVKVVCMRASSAKMGFNLLARHDHDIVLFACVCGQWMVCVGGCSPSFLVSSVAIVWGSWRILARVEALEHEVRILLYFFASRSGGIFDSAQVTEI